MNMTMVQATGLREQAIAEHAVMIEKDHIARQEAALHDARNRAEKLRDLLKDVLGIEATPTDNEWIEDGIRFHAGYDSFDYCWYLYVSQTCPDCDSNLISGHIRSLVDLGAALTGSWQYHEHWWAEDSDKVPASSAAVVPTPTTEQLLLSALRSLIAEQTSQEA